MGSKKEITVKPISFGMTGFKIEDLILKDLREELKKELPTSIVIHLGIGFTDSKDVIFISHDRQDGKYKLERVDAEGTNVELISRAVEVLKKVLS